MTANPNWRIVKVGQTHHLDADCKTTRGVVECGHYYLLDANLHVYICSLSPVLEAYPLYAYATFANDEMRERDEGELELEWQESDVSYLDTSILRTCPHVTAAPYLPDLEDGETSDEYRERVPQEVYEYLSGNPVWFDDTTTTNEQG